MLPAVTQTLAEILAEKTSLIKTEEIDFNRPNPEFTRGKRLSLYCYEIRENQQKRYSAQTANNIADESALPIWYDISFLITAWDSTVLGEQILLSEVLRLLLPYQYLPEAMLAPALQGHGLLPIRVSTGECIDTTAFWRALAVPLRPALHVIVTIPFHLQTADLAERGILLTPTTT